ncbi:uncharacterized protein IL334_004643 [Kwoniella shivajii]|uniref:Conidiation-specific protein 6 n=1 Tax=Kwoniella shivajii TaxID=564305 RepID=A0ABZ1D3W9_9TREE|nr:hypothetical protein IL334_004643 [Kwoniella shivajii]
MSSEHEHRQLGGYKATLHNPNASTEAKAHAAEILEENGIDVNDQSTEKHHDGHAHSGNHQAHDGHAHKNDQLSEHEHRVLGGYKAALHNPNVSEEAKQHAKEVLGQTEDKDDEHEHRVLGGYKAALHNPNVSADAKEHAKEVLKEHHADAA